MAKETSGPVVLGGARKQQARNPIDLMALLPEIQNGRALVEINKAFSELMAEIIDRRKKGAIAIQIFVDPLVDDAKVSSTELTWAVKITKPEATRKKSTFFVTPEGGLSRNDPDQENLFGDTEPEPGSGEE